MTILYIYNSTQDHFEIIESIIVNHKQIINVDATKIYIHYKQYGKQGGSFIKYINEKYPDIIIGKPENFDYQISSTIYDRKNYIKYLKESKNHFYISHEVTNRLKKFNNVFFLTPLSGKNYFKCDVLPYNKQKILSKVPIYIIQGNITKKRRNFNLLKKILNNNYKYDFKIKFLGREREGIGNFFKKKYPNKIILKQKINDFKDFHREFLNGYCILPLITKKSHKQYYTNKLTSTMNYASGYKLKCLIDRNLQNIYKLEDVEIFDDENNIVEAFKKTLQDFYDNN